MQRSCRSRRIGRLRSMRAQPARNAATVLAAVVGALEAGARPASAHEIVPGVSGFASLLLHPFVAVDMALVMAGFALVVGAVKRRPPVVAGIAAVIVGSLVGVSMQPWALSVPGLWRWPLLLACGLGGLGASGVALRAGALLALGFCSAATIGLGVPPERPGWAGTVEVAAAASVALSVALFALALPRAVLGRHAAVRIAGQVGGAWCVAIAGLGLAVALR